MPQPGNPQTLSTNARITARGIRAFVAPFVDGRSDTIVPQPGNPQALNRYSYVLNNPLRYTDPTGMFTEDAIWNYILDHECSGGTECTSKMYSQWQSNTQWWNALLSAGANDLLMTINPFTETMYFFTFQGEGQTLLTGVMATTNPFAIEHGSSGRDSVALSSIYGGGLVDNHLLLYLESLAKRQPV